SSNVFTVSVKDSVPIAFGGDTGHVDEDDLPTGTSPHASALSDTESLHIAWGADNNNTGTTNVRSVAFTNTNIGVSDGFHSLSSLTSDGEPVHTTMIGGVLVGYIGTTAPTSTTGTGVVFNVSLSDGGNGSYTFTLLGNLDHPHDNGQNTLELTFNYTATDSDGDTASNNFTVDVKDDVPQVTGGISTHAVGEDGLPGANLTGGSFDAVDNLSTGAISLNVNWGADNAISSAQDSTGRTLTFNVSNNHGVITPVDSHGNALNLTSDGVGLQYVITTQVNGVQELDAYKGGTHTTANLVFSVVLDPTATHGSYDFTLAGNLDHPASGQQDDKLELNFGITATDSDGDSVSQNFTVEVQDDVPVATPITTQTVGEEGLSFGNHLVAGESQVASTGDLSLNISWGADNNNPTSGGGTHDRSVVFGSHTVSDLQALNLTSNGQALSYVITQDSTGALLTATAGSGAGLHTVFTVQLSDANNGTYNFTLVDNLDHPTVQGGNLDSFTFNVVATDSDGDTANQSFAVNVQDDVPTVTPITTQTVGEEGLSFGNHLVAGESQVATTGDRSLNISWGADANNPTAGGGAHDRSVAFGSHTVSDLNALNLTSNGQALSYVITQDSTGALLTATAGSGNGLHTVFTVQLSDANNGTYHFTIVDNLDHPTAQGGNLDSFTFNVVATDSDGDTANQSFAVNVQDDIPTVTPIAAATVGEEGLTFGNHGISGESQVASTGPVSLNISWGADANNDATSSHDRSVTFASDTVSALNALNLTSHGQAVTYAIATDANGEQTLTASAGGHAVFTVALSDLSNGTYNFTLLQQLDHPSAQGENFINL